MTPTLTTEARVRRLLSRALRPAQASARRALLHTADSLVLLQPASPNPKRVLMVRLDNIGDFVVWLDAARAMVDHFRARGTHVTLLGNAAWAGFASSLGLFDEVIALDQKAFKHKLWYRRRLLTTLRHAGFGTVIQPTVNRLPEMGDAVVRVIGATERIGVALLAATERGKGIADRKLYTKLLPSPPEFFSEMQANASIVRALTAENYHAKVVDLQPTSDTRCLQELADLLPRSPYVVLFPGASAPGRQWPEARFAELAKRCVHDTGRQVLFCGGPGDVAIAEAAALAAGPGVTSLAGKTSLQQLTTLIAGAELLVSNETSAVHIAAAVGVPSVCIVGGGHFGRFLPYDEASQDHRPLPVVAAHRMECFGCNWVCKFHPAKGKPMPCVEQVTVETVWELTASALQSQHREETACV